MSITRTATHEATPVSHTTEYDGSHSSSAELLTPAPLELQFPNATQYDTFDTILRCDAAENPEQRLVDSTLARDVLLDKLNRARHTRARANKCNPNDFVSEQELLEAYCDGIDAYAGLMTLAPPLNNGNEQAMDVFREWSQLATGAITRAESRGTAPSTTIFRTPASLAGAQDDFASVRNTLSERARFERVKRYNIAAQSNDTTQIREAFIGDDATRLNRAKALFSYAHSLPQGAEALKVACLEESIEVIHDAVTNGERPHEEDLVGIYEYFMLQSMLGRAVHDIVLLDGHDTEDDRARSLSVQYLTNSADAFNYVRANLITSQEEPEEALRRDSRAFDARVKTDPEMTAARGTIDFLAGGLKELFEAEKELHELKNDPWDYEGKAAKIDIGEKHVAYLKAKAEYEQLREKIAEEHEVLAQRLGVLRAEHQSIADRLLELRSKAIGDIRPNTYGRRLTQVVLDIDQQLNEARYFAALYDKESKEGTQQEYDAQQFGLAVVRVLETLEGIRPDADSMNASTFRTPVDAKK